MMPFHLKVDDNMAKWRCLPFSGGMWPSALPNISGSRTSDLEWPPRRPPVPPDWSATLTGPSSVSAVKTGVADSQLEFEVQAALIASE
jgi:hypothetical protein